MVFFISNISGLGCIQTVSWPRVNFCVEFWRLFQCPDSPCSSHLQVIRLATLNSLKMLMFMHGTIIMALLCSPTQYMFPYSQCSPDRIWIHYSLDLVVKTMKRHFLKSLPKLWKKYKTWQPYGSKMCLGVSETWMARPITQVYSGEHFTNRFTDNSSLIINLISKTHTMYN